MHALGRLVLRFGDHATRSAWVVQKFPLAISLREVAWAIARNSSCFPPHAIID
jgi:hypothetical protein